MAEELLFGPEETALEILNNLGSIGKWLQAIGLIAVLWIVFEVVQFVYNRRRVKRLDEIEEKLGIIENKLDKALKRK